MASWTCCSVPSTCSRSPWTAAASARRAATSGLYFDELTLFGQYVYQDLAGLVRTGFEIEGSYTFYEPFGSGSSGTAFVSDIAPAVRFSRLDPDFAAPSVTPSPSFAWPWDKWDFGIRVGLGEVSDLTVEYSLNEFRLGNGSVERNDEFLLTLRLAFER